MNITYEATANSDNSTTTTIKFNDQSGLQLIWTDIKKHYRNIRSCKIHTTIDLQVTEVNCKSRNIDLLIYNQNNEMAITCSLQQAFKMLKTLNTIFKTKFCFCTIEPKNVHEKVHENDVHDIVQELVNNVSTAAITPPITTTTTDEKTQPPTKQTEAAVDFVVDAGLANASASTTFIVTKTATADAITVPSITTHIEKTMSQT